MVAQVADKSSVASDVGCGIGRCLPDLAAAFRKVIAVDISETCLDKARAKCAHLPNIEYIRADIAKASTRLPPVDVCLCVNVLLHPSINTVRRMLASIARHLKAGGAAIFVVPSLESILLTDVREIQWNLRRGFSERRAGRDGYFAPQKNDGRDLSRGVAVIDGVATKHYLREEIEVLCAERGLMLQRVQKLEYPWRTEFCSPPRWMKEPYPWDWLAIVRKRGGTKASGCATR